MIHAGHFSFQNLMQKPHTCVPYVGPINIASIGFNSLNYKVWRNMMHKNQDFKLLFNWEETY